MTSSDVVPPLLCDAASEARPDIRVEEEKMKWSRFYAVSSCFYTERMYLWAIMGLELSPKFKLGQSFLVDFILFQALPRWTNFTKIEPIIMNPRTLVSTTLPSTTSSLKVHLASKWVLVDQMATRLRD